MPPDAPRDLGRGVAFTPLLPPLPDDRPVAVLIRHAERPPIPDGQPGIELALTPAGAAQSRALGAWLGGRLHALWTSPIRRCRETAEHMGAGSGRTVAITDDPLLGDPGVFVVDAERAWVNWERLGNDGVIEHLMTGQGALPGMREPDAGAALLLDHLAGALAGPVGVRVFVTHDAVLAPCVARLLGVTLDRASWPRFLEGAAIWVSDRGLAVRYREHERLLS